MPRRVIRRAHRALALAGKGIIALFEFLATDELARGTLVRVLPHRPGTSWPIHALYPKNRHLLPKVGVFLDFLRDLFAATVQNRPAWSSSS